ncbi:hypothetical protein HHJ68_06815 [Mobiluncus curtisii]|nr:hypothetical protein [Mobiluncus curtisii]NMW83673.1 hypothetical protein [Mobiluncus curtisii]NMW98914.1 hypothetical protein [Mobiluncus curtisii]NMX06190.1 hypothetical protein [Mobiluncus curtisii]
MGQARNDDRFSDGVRLLDLDQQAQRPHSVEVALHKNQGKLGLAATRPIKMAQDLRTYTEIKANRAAAASNRVTSARRRAGLLGAMVLALIIVGAFAATGFLAWWVMVAPVMGIGATISWGVIAAKHGREQDRQFQQSIRALEKRLAQSPAGRAALQSVGMRGAKQWAKVAATSLAGGKQMPGTLAQAVQMANEAAPATAVSITAETDRPADMKRSVQKSADVEVPEKAAKVNSHSDKQITSEKAPNSELVEKPTKTASEPAAKKWNPADLPTPSYTLKTGAIRQVVVEQDFRADWQYAPVPMRPQTAQILPAGEALSAEDISVAPVDLESILERRRASGD